MSRAVASPARTLYGDSRASYRVRAGLAPALETLASIRPFSQKMTSFPPLLHGRNYANFRREEYYFVTLFDLLLTLYSIPFDDPLVRDLRENLRKDAEGLSTKR